MRTIREILDAAQAKGFELALLYELRAGEHWMARFTRIVPIIGRSRDLPQAIADTANEAMELAFKEIADPGYNDKMEVAAAVRKWAAINAARPAPETRPEKPEDPNRLAKWLAGNVEMAADFMYALRGLVNTYDGDEDEGEDFL